MKYTLDYTTRMPTREKITKPWKNFMEYGLIFHVTRIGGNFRGIWADIPRYAYQEILLKEYEV